MCYCNLVFFEFWMWILVFIFTVLFCLINAIFVVSVMEFCVFFSFDCELLIYIYNLNIVLFLLFNIINAIIVVTVMGIWCFLSFDCEFQVFCIDFGSFWLFECVGVSVELLFFLYLGCLIGSYTELYFILLFFNCLCLVHAVLCS